jgi:hypothetical protein
MPDDMSEVNEQAGVIRLFTEFLKAYAMAGDEERHAFLDFINPQTRADLIHLADTLRQKDLASEDDLT